MPLACLGILDTAAVEDLTKYYSPGVGKPALCMSRKSQKPSYKEPQHKNLKTRIYLQFTFL